ncbi:MAG: DivIVA domain-containing protein [Cyclobacteriaceae bacterium]|nr:DivIVA domain-containing protein [Cyclobacteriaceae bacterium]MCK5208226.1 DivIVA domain-containing protein [Cyclobacteriaceae bacterium]MCK5278148.1 DivIVA domain-containing protein [Cyclobacteriaceae bacterium]
MKITPIEIRKKTFEKVFRGFDKDEVIAFLQILSTEWEKSVDEKKEVVIKLEAAEKEIAKLREVENSLYKTLKTAEDTGANMIEQANKAAELQLKETKMESENIVREAKAKSKMIFESTEKHTREIIANMLGEIKSLEHNFNSALSLKENLIADLTNLSSATLERVQKFKKQKDKLDIDKYIKEAREFAENYDLKNFKFNSEELEKNLEKEELEIKVSNRKKKESAEKAENSENSFFDLLE